MGTVNCWHVCEHVCQVCPMCDDSPAGNMQFKVIQVSDKLSVTHLGASGVICIRGNAEEQHTRTYACCPSLHHARQAAEVQQAQQAAETLKQCGIAGEEVDDVGRPVGDRVLISEAGA